jgi:hypothetical protein
MEMYCAFSVVETNIFEMNFKFHCDDLPKSATCAVHQIKFSWYAVHDNRKCREKENKERLPAWSCLPISNRVISLRLFAYPTEFNTRQPRPAMSLSPPPPHQGQGEGSRNVCIHGLQEHLYGQMSLRIQIRDMHKTNFILVVWINGIFPPFSISVPPPPPKKCRVEAQACRSQSKYRTSHLFACVDIFWRTCTMRWRPVLVL